MKEISKINIAGDERTIGAEGEITKINVNGKEYTLAGSGTKVVTELPEVGEEHTIYELRESKPVSYNWVAHTPLQLEDDGFSIGVVSWYTFIFDTYEQMTSVFENITQPSESLELGYYVAYIRIEDKMYMMQPTGEGWSFEERVKVSAYTFARPDSEIGNIYILKSYEGYDEATDKYYGTLYDNTKVELLENQDLAFILTQVTDYGQMDYGILLNKFAVHTVTQLPTAQEAVENYLDELIANDGVIVVEIDGVAKYNIPENRNYHWLNIPEIGAPNFYTGHEEPVVYTGELDWEDIPGSPFDTIPYQEIINEGTINWTFKPWAGGDKISYWIYSNGTWTNVEDIGKPVEQEVIYGELLKGDTFNVDRKLISPYTNEQICNYLVEGKPVILRYHDNAYMSENEFMYVYINNFNDTEMDVEYVNQPLYYNNFTCREYSTTDSIEYDFSSDYFYYEFGE